ncbi:hypothetical protein BGP77_15360 [Saccharospirillum sp. MSK14-1]|uniref:hypothetical protein n=1 Tax=Saccharospirillum sp. MSK14-1 TaxID=1897632 RepID=UPI000D3C97FE|nr:hypothetical protein [Saccharospirillum sp. MSK14-1]PTY37849.1 hypothetical protein BGP77_15360 [Saccharospirillum sp. MSK14-1]
MVRSVAATPDGEQRYCCPEQGWLICRNDRCWVPVMPPTSRPWLLPLLAHLMLIVTVPFWVFALIFSPLLLANYDQGPPPAIILLFALFWIVPVMLIALFGVLWHALYKGYALRANRLASLLLAAQLMALLWLLFAH